MLKYTKCGRLIGSVLSRSNHSHNNHHLLQRSILSFIGNRNFTENSNLTDNHGQQLPDPHALINDLEDPNDTKVRYNTDNEDDNKKNLTFKNTIKWWKIKMM